MNRNSAFKLLVLILAGMLLMGACVAPAAPAPAAPAAEEPAPAEEPAAPEPADEPADEVTEFVFAHTGPIRTMDAPVTWFGSTHWLTNLGYDCLIWRAADGNGFVPQAAERWENIDPLTWRFYLREGNTFHNGEPLDAKAVKWNIDRVRTREDFLVHPQWAFVDEVIIVDDWTVDVTTGQPEAYFEYVVSYNGCELLPPGYMEEVGEEAFALAPVGSGPYKFGELVLNEKYVFEAWDDYWGGRPEVDRVIYQVIPETSSQVAALLAGQVDFVRAVPEPDRPRLEAAEDIDLTFGPSNQQHLFQTRWESVSGTLPEEHPGYESTTLDVKIRQAVSHALDRALLAEIHGSARPALLRVDDYHPEARGQYAGEEAATAHYQPERAKELIIEAGFDPDGGNKPIIHIDSANVYSGGEKETAEAAAAMLEDVGFEVVLGVLDRAAYSEQILEPGAWRELALVPIGGGPSLTPLFYSVEWEDPGGYAVYLVEGDWDKTSKAILTETNFDKRMELWETWWDFYVEEAGEITMYFMDAVYGMNNEFEWTPRADGWMTFRDLKIKK